MSLEPGRVDVRHCATCGTDTPHARLVARTWVYLLVVVGLGAIVPAVLLRSVSFALAGLIAIAVASKPWRGVSIPSICQRCRFRGFHAKHLERERARQRQTWRRAFLV